MLGLTPRDVDRHSFRDLAIMFRGAEDRIKEEWRHTFYAIQDMRSVIAGDKKPIDHLHRRVFGSGIKSSKRFASREEHRAWLKEADRKIKERYGRRK